MSHVILSTHSSHISDKVHKVFRASLHSDIIFFLRESQEV